MILILHNSQERRCDVIDLSYCGPCCLNLGGFGKGLAVVASSNHLSLSLSLSTTPGNERATINQLIDRLKTFDQTRVSTVLAGMNTVLLGFYHYPSPYPLQPTFEAFIEPVLR